MSELVQKFHDYEVCSCCVCQCLRVLMKAGKVAATKLDTGEWSFYAVPKDTLQKGGIDGGL